MFRITPPDIHAMREAKRLLDGFIKPPGSLGTLEEIAIRLAGITGHARNTLKRKVITLFGSDHGSTLRECVRRLKTSLRD